MLADELNDGGRVAAKSFAFLPAAGDTRGICESVTVELPETIGHVSGVFGFFHIAASELDPRGIFASDALQ
jgi:hypothetical protein